MDRSTLTQAMKASISEVLEQMFFLPVDFAAPAGADAKHDPESVIARLDFHGSASGTFVLCVPASLARSVAADFLGSTTQDLSKDQVTGTVLEMVNMLAGGTLSKYDHRALFDLQIPELITARNLNVLTEGVVDRIVIGVQTPDSRMSFALIVR